MIISFHDPETAKVFRNQISRKLPADMQTTALRKLLQLHAAVSLDSLRVPPGNRLETLKRNRLGQQAFGLMISIAFGLMISGAFALFGRKLMKKTKLVLERVKSKL